MIPWSHKNGFLPGRPNWLPLSAEYAQNRYALLEYGSAFRWQEHYLLIQGTKGAIKIDMCCCGMTLKTENFNDNVQASAVAMEFLAASPVSRGRNSSLASSP